MKRGLVIGLLGLTAVLFQNCNPFSLSSLILTSEDARADVNWYSNNTQSIEGFMFGPSIRASDARTIFDLGSYRGMWSNLSSKTKEVLLSSTFLADRRIEEMGEPVQPSSVYLDRDDIGNLKEVVEEYNLKINIEVGLGLSGSRCVYDSPTELGMAAARKDFIHTAKRLIDRGIIVSKIHVDGPFLRLIEGSRKDHSCEDVPQFSAKNTSFTATAVAVYMKQFRNLIFHAQRNLRDHREMRIDPKVSLLLNLPNWRYAGYMELFRWQNDNPSSGIVWNQEPNLHPIISTFITQVAAYGLTISDVVIDYPYNLIDSNSHRKLTNSGTNDHCGQGVNCSYVSGREVFSAKIRTLWAQTRSLPGRPKFSFITNTSGSLTPCFDAANTTLPLLPYDDAGAGACSQSEQEELDRTYFRKSQVYSKLVKFGLPSEIEVENVIFQSWHTNPFRNSLYAYFAKIYIDEID